MVNEKLVQNNFHISYAYCLLSQRHLYLLRSKSNCRRWEIIFLSRQIPSAIALFLKTSAFQRFLMENREKKSKWTFLIAKEYVRHEISSIYVFGFVYVFAVIFLLVFCNVFFFRWLSTPLFVRHFLFFVRDFLTFCVTYAKIFVRYVIFTISFHVDSHVPTKDLNPNSSVTHLFLIKQQADTFSHFHLFLLATILRFWNPFETKSFHWQYLNYWTINKFKMIITWWSKNILPYCFTWYFIKSCF